MTPESVIEQVRILINDDNPLMEARYSDDDLLKLVNQAVKRACIVRPDLFVVTTTVTPTADAAQQEMASSVTRIVQIHGVVDGDAVLEVDKTAMDACAPGWRVEASDVPVNWMRNPRNPRGYFLYPPPETGTVLDVEVVQVPDDYAIDDTIDMPDSYLSALVDCTVFLSEITDDETVLTERGKMFHASFMQQMGADQNQRSLVDNEHANVSTRTPQAQQQSEEG